MAPNALVENVAVLYGTSRTKVLNTVALLEDLGIVAMRGKMVASVELVAEIDVLGDRLVEYVIEEHLPLGLGDAMLLAEGTDELWVDAKRAPGRHLGIGSLLVELGVFHRDRLTSPNWRISERYSEQFVQAVARSNEAFALGSLSARELRRRVEEDFDAGLRAEEWVVNFERCRLVGHPLRRQIRRVSEQHADAGFDVLSFRDGSSVGHNWLIEVKSFVGTPRFYWTGNEIECARREGARYVLYLVDRARMQAQGYQPRAIREPYRFFFGPDRPIGWDVVATEYRISASA